MSWRKMMLGDAISKRISRRWGYEEMDADRKIIIIAGPNGAGKSSTIGSSLTIVVILPIG